VQAKAVFSVGQPNRVLIRVSYWTRLVLQLGSTNNRIDAHIDEGRDGDWSGNGDAVFKIAVQTEVAAGSYELIVGNWDIPAVAGRTLPKSSSAPESEDWAERTFHRRS